MKLSRKIGAGFGVLIVAAYILGGADVWIMKDVIRDSSMLSSAYVPYVLIGNKTERFSMGMAYAIRGYILSEDKTYLDDVNENLIKVKDSLRQTKKLTDRSPYFGNLEQRVEKSEEKVSEYEHLIKEIVLRNEIITENRNILENSALEYTTHCIEFMQKQNEAMKKQIASEFISAYEAELIEIRFKKIALMFEVIELSNSIRFANSRFQSIHDPQMVQDALNTFVTMNMKLKELMDITSKEKVAKTNERRDIRIEEEEIRDIENISATSNTYQEAVKRILDNWMAMKELKRKCENTADIFLNEAVSMSESGMTETKKVSQEIQSTLISAASIIVIGFIVWGIGSVFFAIFMTITYITKPINRLVHLVRKVAEGDLSESSDTVQSDLTRKDEIGIMTYDMIQMTNRIRDVLKEIERLIYSVEQGMLEIRGNEQIFSGAWQELVVGVNNVVNSFMTPFKMTAQHIDRISVGDIPDIITEEYNGDFNKIKNNLNLLIEATVLTTRLAEEIAGGNLTADVRERSEHDRMMTALNRMIRRLNGIISETTGMIYAVRQGKLDIRGNAEAFEGGWQELVSGINDLISGLSAAVSEKAALNQEMALARRIQTSLLPTLTENFHPDFQIAAAMIPAEQVGGDFYDISYDRKGTLWVAVGDVSGHGVTPGLIMMMAQTVHSTVTTNIDCDARDVVIKINEILYKNVHERLNESHFMTFTALKYLEEGRFQHAGAHLSMIVFRQETGACELIRTKGVYLNLKADISHGTKNAEFYLDYGDILVLYTDGLTEAHNPGGGMFDIGGFIKIVQEHAHQEPKNMKDRIMADVLRWCENLRSDDMSLVIIKRIGGNHA